MFDEILEEPSALRETLTAVADKCRETASKLTQGKPDLIYFSGSGTSYHAAVAAQYLMASLSTRATNSIPASEFDSWVRTPSGRGNVVIAISQSGESIDVLTALRTAKKRGISSVAITNTNKSSMAREADYALVTEAGPEKAVTATKTFVCCLAAAYLLSLELMEASGSFSSTDEELSSLRRQLMESPVIVQQTIENCEGQATTLADRFRSRSLFFLLGRGANYATALEGALKLKESCNVMAEGHAAREFLHGPMQLVDENSLVITISTRADSESIGPLTQSFRRLGAPVIYLSDAALAEPAECLTVAGGLSESLSPLAFIAPLQLFSYHSAVVRGLDPDKPTKLTKVVR